MSFEGKLRQFPAAERNEKRRGVVDVRLMKQEGHLIPRPKGESARDPDWDLAFSWRKLYQALNIAPTVHVQAWSCR